MLLLFVIEEYIYLHIHLETRINQLTQRSTWSNHLKIGDRQIMAEANIEDGPIFVDVSSSHQFPSMFVQLLTGDDMSSTTSTNTGPVKEELATNSTSDNTPEEKDKSSTDSLDPDGRLKCKLCNRWSAKDEEQLIRHIRKNHKGENPFQCSMCDYSTYNKAVFEEHIRVHEGVKPFKCSYCDYASASKKNTKKHELRHRKDNPNKCQDCDFIGRNPQSYKHHRMTQHNDSEDCSYSCKDCKHIFSSKHKLRCHRKNRKKCDDCKFVSCTIKGLRTHEKCCHDKEKPMLKRDLNKMFKCAHCTWTSFNKARILLHLIHHPDQKVNEKLIDLTVLRKFGIMK